MTRKRFIKTLMAAGVSRNSANRTSKCVQKVGWPYQRFYDDIMRPVVDPIMRAREWWND